MTDERSDLMLEMLKRIRGDVLDIKNEIGDLKLRMHAVEEHVGSIVVSLSGVNHRLDRMDERIGRVERRLELVDAR
ncbi:hypothetical protein [Sandaracinobacteroides saxicola]|uniref:t-SNARE coiled-coil homology domain-containing protein n=1 Tax=Sandaracinobacteroides saxicola TaxID=2759707 RepID=A0A7G5IER0_9SPHN|nr:hypothetical protein [Sandaracinobacteroides saxicola]QMW21852.1 hypothetical protein H3309_10645 [Sandaracinobacteroides saxicola]